MDATTKKRLKNGITAASFIKTKKEGEAGIFKTEGYNEERAAYIVDRFFGFNLVPTTVIKTLGEQTGSFQKFIPDAKGYYEIKNADRKATEERVRELRIFDFLIGNPDRHNDNFLIDEKGGVFAIDHHSAFCQKPYRYIHEIIGKEIPAQTKEKILEFSKWENGKIILKGLLGELLGEKKIDYFFKRFEVLIGCAERGRFLDIGEFDRLEI